MSGPIKYFLEELEAALPLEPVKKAMHSGNVFAWPGKKSALFAQDGLPDMNAAAHANMSYRRFDALAPSDMNELLSDLVSFGPFAAMTDSDRVEWLSLIFGFADAAQLGATKARDLALAWSTPGQTFSKDAFDQAWQSYQPGKIMVGTLIRAARLAGFDFSPWFLVLSASNVGPVVSATTVVSTHVAPSGPWSSSVDPFDATAGWAATDQIDFLYGYMLARGYVTLLGASGGTGKSALMSGIAVCCALGRPLLGDKIAGQLRVLTINLEDGRSKLRRGLKAIVQHYKLSHTDLVGWLFVAGANDVAAALNGGLRLIIVDPATRREVINEAAVSWLRQEVMRRSLDILMIDPFSRLIRGNENAVDVVDQLMERLALLAAEANIAIMIAQHTRKAAGGIAADGVAAFRGSGAVPDAARNAYGLLKPSEADAVQIGAFGNDPLVAMDHLKGNLSRLDDRSYYRLVGVRLPGGNPANDPPQVERGRWAHTVERFMPVTVSQSITDPMRNAVMVVLNAQTRDKHGALIPFGVPSTNGKSARSPIPPASAALQAAVPGLSPERAEKLAAEVIKDLLAKGYVSNNPVKLPSYKKSGLPNGSNDGTGLCCHFAATPWRVNATATVLPPPVLPAVAPPNFQKPTQP